MRISSMSDDLKFEDEAKLLAPHIRKMVDEFLAAMVSGDRKQILDDLDHIDAVQGHVDGISEIARHLYYQSLGLLKDLDIQARFVRTLESLELGPSV
jgi:hypothetical protein